MHVQRAEGEASVMLVLDPREMVILAESARDMVAEVEVSWIEGEIDDDYFQRTRGTLVDINRAILVLTDDEIVAGARSMHETHDHDSAYFEALEEQVRTALAEKRASDL